MIIFGAITRGYETELLDWGKANPDHKLLVRFIWYMGFASFDLLGIYAIQKCNELFNVHAGRVARVILLVFLARGLLQLVSYAELVLWQTGHLAFIYTTGIVSINGMSALSCFCLAVAYSIGVFCFRRGKRDEMWEI